MNLSNLIKGNRIYFSRFYKLVASAVIITTAVITGSLMIGDSVRTTLVNRANERLGDTETVIFSMQSFMDDNIVHHPVFEGHTRAILVTNGFIPQSGRLIPVMVWGVNDMSISAGEARINSSLAKELNISSGDIVLRLPATGMVPSGSLFVTDNYTTGMRLELDGIVDVKQHGNLSLKNEQSLPLNIFVNRNELAEVIETEGKINLLLSEQNISSADLDKAWNPAISGIKTEIKDGFTEITSDRVFLQEEVVQAIRSHNPETNRLFSYLVNSIEYGRIVIPYSFVTAMDEYRGYTLKPDEIIVSDYTARRLGVKENDTLRLSFYTSEKLKTLLSDTIKHRVSRIVPLHELVADSTLSADFPGLANAERCTDWNADLPIDMTRITDEDEKYWEDHKSTPKAIISYQAVADRWSTSFGSATALRIEAPPSPPERGEFLSPFGGVGGGSFGIQLNHPREKAFQAAQSGVDFSGLFLSLGFFIILSAILLMLVPLSEMLFRRKNETSLMYSLGYTSKRIIKLYWLESVPVVLWSSIAGVVAGLIYTGLVLFLLGTVWKGATHTEGFRIYPHIQTMLFGLLTGVLLSACLLRIALARSLKNLIRRKSRKTISLRSKLFLSVVFSATVLLIAFVNQMFVQSVVLFMVAGVTFIGAAAMAGNYLICRNGMLTDKPFTKTGPVRKPLFAGRNQAMLSFLSLAMGVFIVFTVGLNRQGFADNSRIATGTGGYSLWCENSVPVYHNLSTSLGREKLALTGLPADTEILQFLRYGADDASCLNLNKVSNPTVLGVDMEQLSRSRFSIDRSLWPNEDENTFEPFRYRTDSVYPVLVDETVLTWGLGLNPGDTIVYEGSKGKRAVLRLAGTLHNSIFQGNILIDRQLFSEIWDDIAGSEVMLVKVKEDETESVKMLISQAMRDYGVIVTTTADRLKMFNSVTDTYLTIFLMLGSIGLLLGLMSFVIVIRKNLASRQEEIGVYRSLGFPVRKIRDFLRIENSIVPLYAIGTGVIGAILASGGGIANVSIGVWFTLFIFSVLFVAGILVFVKKEVERIIENGYYNLKN
ncbi:MAG: ABC transporter permease [Tannerella sp.]|nr:ABC transporter permease [Tannerella sp.]